MDTLPTIEKSQFFTARAGSETSRFLVAPTGFSAEELAIYQKLHKEFYDADTKHSTSHIDYAVIKSINLKDPSSLTDNPDALEYISLVYKRESFSDVAALGEMLKNGGRSGLIDDLFKLRNRIGEDILHRTSPVIEGLRKEIIARGGIDKFNDMDKDERLKLYDDVVEKYGMSAQNFSLALQHSAASSTQWGQTVVMDDVEIKKSLDFRQYLSPHYGSALPVSSKFFTPPAPIAETPVTPEPAEEKKTDVAITRKNNTNNIQIKNGV